MQRMRIVSLLLALMISVVSVPCQANDPTQDQYGYYGFEPDIITNYITYGKTLGYIRVTVEIMVSKESDIETIDHHAPLLRDAIIRILGEQSEQKIKSLTGREEIRVKCLTAVNELLVQESGEKVAKDLLFTKYLYQ